MTAFMSLFISNLKRRVTDGFSVGYNIVFPLFMIWILGLLCKGMFSGGETTGYQYYGVVMVPFCIMLSVITAAYAGKDDAYAKTADRILIAPISNTAIVCSKIFAETIVFAMCSMIVLLISVVLWNVCHVKEIGDFLLCYIATSFVTACIGTYLGLGMKDFLKLKNILNIPVLVFAILGGSYFPFGTFSKVLLFLIDLSPLKWINRSLFLLVYDHNDMFLYVTCIVMVVIGMVFMLLAIALFKREEYGNGELPGYEK